MTDMATVEALIVDSVFVSFLEPLDVGVCKVDTGVICGGALHVRAFGSECG
jgi:hypothetical protein